ncbi:MAG TPA: type II toxin-antitoxin system VapC family toxin [Actinomycetales bacterium]|nr:type II toxin-antitoxin system VapC family toxin [Actinomycetales bacterium]
MIFVDTNVFMYAVGGAHPLRTPARETLTGHRRARRPMATSVEVLQEFLHAYLPVGRLETLDAALQLATDLAEVWTVDPDDVRDARLLHDRHPHLSARDLMHLAVCASRGVDELLTYDRGLAAAFSR